MCGRFGVDPLCIPLRTPGAIIALLADRERSAAIDRTR
jgi:hypothetical protein